MSLLCCFLVSWVFGFSIEKGRLLKALLFVQSAYTLYRKLGFVVSFRRDYKKTKKPYLVLNIGTTPL